VVVGEYILCNIVRMDDNFINVGIILKYSEQLQLKAIITALLLMTQLTELLEVFLYLYAFMFLKCEIIQSSIYWHIISNVTFPQV